MEPLVRVAVYHSNSDVRLEQRARPSVGAGELLMSIKASGICGSDVMEWYRLPRAPLVLGHEVAGVVEEAGPGVTRFAPGDRIVATHHVPCGRCRYCLTDRHSVCETLRTTSFDPGGFSELVRLPAINVEHGTFLLPDNVTFEEGSFVEPLACVVRAQRLTGLRHGDDVAVLGSGVSGVLQIQVARAAGARRIIAIDVDDSRLDAARRFGADVTLGAREDLVERVRAANGGRLVDHVIVCTGARRATEQALQLADLGGTVLYFATLSPGEDLTVDANDLWKRGISIVHSYAGPPADMRAALELIAKRRVDVGSMVTHRFGLAETGLGFDLMVHPRDSLKVIIEPER
jgi:L-iditol 2-dehydrogenase